MISPVRRPTTAIESAKTWSEMVRAIDAERKTLPWTEAPTPATQISMLDRKTKERELDPIVMQFRDAEKEQQHMTHKTLRTCTLPLQRYETLKKTSFNIVSHESPPRLMDSMAPHLLTKQPLGQREWHLFSHLRQDRHTTCPILYDAQYMNAHAVPKSGVPLSENRSSNPRTFNIINNRFSRNHDEQVRGEYNVMKEVMVKKYWATHKMDLIRGEHYSDAEEEACRSRERDAALTHGQAFMSTLPQSFKYSEGNSYNILTTAVKDAELIKVALQRESRKNNRLTKFKHVAGQQRAAGEAEYANWEQRKLARVSFKRWEGELDRGYDFVKPAVQLDPTQTREPLPQRDPCLWKRVSTSLDGGIARMNETSQGSFYTSDSPNPGWAGETEGGSGRLSGRLSGRVPSTGRNPADFPSPSPTPMLSHRSRLGNTTAGSGNLSKVPSLDMTAIAAVRTGGLSEYAL